MWAAVLHWDPDLLIIRDWTVSIGGFGTVPHWDPDLRRVRGGTVSTAGWAGGGAGTGLVADGAGMGGGAVRRPGGGARGGDEATGGVTEREGGTVVSVGTGQHLGTVREASECR